MSQVLRSVGHQTGRRAWPALLHRVVRTIRSRSLAEPGQHLLVAVSGGSDSVALLSLLYRLRSPWRLTLTAVHYNYGLRGSESDSDQEFVRALCREIEVPLHTKRLEVRISSRRTSVQEAARDLRYSAMAELAEQVQADRVALGHTADDQAETVLLWLLRGSGLSGLSGMPAMREGRFIRPLYDTRRRELLSYLHETGLSFREDSSNAKPLYLRNRIRREILPALQRVVPSSVRAICRLADICREDDIYLDQHVTQLGQGKVTRLDDVGGWVVNRAFLQGIPRSMQRRIIRDVLRQCHGDGRSSHLGVVDRLIELATVGSLPVEVTVDSIRLSVSADGIHISPWASETMTGTTSAALGSPILAVPGEVKWQATGQIIRTEECRTGDEDHTDVGKWRIMVDADRLSLPLVVRAWQPGDRFRPAGMKGRTRKLQDFFTDLKVPRAIRRRIPLVVMPEGIVWVVGYRQDERWVPGLETKRRVVMTARAYQGGEGP